MSRGQEALDQAYREIPKRPYEGLSKKFYSLGFLGIYLPTFAVLHTILLDEYQTFTEHYPFAPSLIGASIFALSILTDTRSTIQGLRAIDQAKKVGIPAFHGEGNDLLSHITSPEEFKKSKTHMALQLGGLVASALLPETGVALASLKFIASANNRRVARRYNRAVEIVRGR